MIEYRVIRDGTLELATTDDRLALLRARNLKETFADTAAVVIVLLTEDEVVFEAEGFAGRPFGVSAVEQAADVLELERLGLAS